VVASGLVRTGDVASVEGEDRALVERVRSVALGSAPAEGDTISIARSRVEARLREEGLPDSLVLVTGEPYTVVVRGAALLAVPAATQETLRAPDAHVLRHDSTGKSALKEHTTFRANDTVTVILESMPRVEDASPAAAAARASKTETPLILLGLGARVVKVLPNGNLALEARVSIGSGYVLLAGEVARADVDVRRTTHISRLAKLVVIARGLDAEVLGPLLGAAAK
jgi:flagellar basal body L-ring protein FlgH